VHFAWVVQIIVLIIELRVSLWISLTYDCFWCFWIYIHAMRVFCSHQIFTFASVPSVYSRELYCTYGALWPIDTNICKLVSACLLQAGLGVTLPLSSFEVQYTPWNHTPSLPISTRWSEGCLCPKPAFANCINHYMQTTAGPLTTDI